MQEDDDSLLGWKSMQFLYGAGASVFAASDAVEVSKNKDRACHKDSCGCGCYVATCDFEKLDQQ